MASNEQNLERMASRDWDSHMGCSYLLQAAAELMRDYDFDQEARQLAAGASLAPHLGPAQNEERFRETLARVLSFDAGQVEAAVQEVHRMIEKFGRVC